MTEQDKYVMGVSALVAAVIMAKHTIKGLADKNHPEHAQVLAMSDEIMQTLEMSLDTAKLALDFDVDALKNLVGDK